MKQEKIILTFRQLLMVLTLTPLLTIGAGTVLGIMDLGNRPQVQATARTPTDSAPVALITEIKAQAPEPRPELAKVVTTDPGEKLALVRAKTGVQVEPAELEAIISAEEKTGVHWQTLVAQYRIESRCGRDPNMYKYNPYHVLDTRQVAALERLCGKLGRDPKKVRCARYGELGPFQIRPAEFEAYAVDANGDGRADPWNVDDAAVTAANYLDTLGYSAAPRTAIARYNAGKHYQLQSGRVYSQKVLHLAKDLGAPPKL